MDFNHQHKIGLIQKAFGRYMDDEFLIWPKQLDINILIGIINKLHQKIKYTVERGKIFGNKQELNMLDIKIILHESRSAMSCAYIVLPEKTEGMYTEMLREVFRT